MKYSRPFKQALLYEERNEAAVFKLGDYVEWVEAARDPLSENAIGKIDAIIPSDTGRADFNLYDVEFPFGRRTLHGTQLSLKESVGPDNLS